ncbi:LytTR family DNA-binding domain-containing protein [uncultured Anaerococcus sp.]|uniref:LytTR family DNA-binding domain-containing protein n=1 Tax=uncultured Anaerococcus sp. TaxID=293428 RepID=UPI002803901D|nr:LytTR family DNA-binding domain-containing protein [uncultured Anaerococcus sp.]
MKVEIIIDESIEETEVKIYAKEYSKDVENIRDVLTEKFVDKIVAFKCREVFILSFDEIIRIYAQDKNVYIKTKDSTYTTRLTIYEFESRTDRRNFIRISRSEIVNLDYVKRLDLSFTGTIAVELLNGDVSYVSRRKLKEFKKALGL